MKSIEPAGRRSRSVIRSPAIRFVKIAQGRSLDEAAKDRGVTRNTARTQLKQVFAKTGTKRQGELVRLVLSGVAPIRDD